METSITLPALGPLEYKLLWVVLASAFVALFYGLVLMRRVLKQPTREEMLPVTKAIQEGSAAYLGRQFKTLVWFLMAITIGLFVLYRPVFPGNMVIPMGIAVAFLLGSLASFGAGVVGMTLATRANGKVATAALSSYKKALETAFQAGGVSGMFTVGLGLLGATVIFMIFKQDAMKVLVGFGFGGCLAALFMRVGGGIFTKAADVGADLVGKIEQGIPEDDPRNAATIADNVGDNVGDCAGMAADVFESYEVTLVAAIILGAATLADKGFVLKYGGTALASAFALKLILYPLLVRAVGVFGSIIGIASVRGKDDADMDPMRPINQGFWIAGVVSVIGFGLVNYFYLKNPVTGLPDWRFFFATLTGIILAMVIGKLTEYFTSTECAPVCEIADSTRTGAATMLLSGFALGLESSVWSVVAIAATIAASAAIFGGDLALSAYGIALSGLGLLTTTGFILAMDTYGPIS
ncbi:MAG: sodium/proton-translocating pyrophosphatase, partial [bacterium]|nr:sodium/proton-translocating pyrophosphatase [bacterium]